MGLVKKNAGTLVELVFGSKVFSLGPLRIFRKFAYRMLFSIGRNVEIGSGVNAHLSHHEFGGKLKVGSNSTLCDDVFLDYTGGISIGEKVMISPEVHIYTHAHDIDGCSMYDEKKDATDLTIGDEVWIGARATVLPSVRKIGRGAVIGACAVVTKDVEPFSIVCGNPAKEIRKRARF